MQALCMFMLQGLEKNLPVASGIGGGSADAAAVLSGLREFWGLGESIDDRIGMLVTLSSLAKHPESVPINSLVPVEGTPLEEQQSASIWEMIRMVATTRIVMPKSAVRLSAGRLQMSMEGQGMCFMAGANSIFAGDELLTTPNPEFNQDQEMFKILGLVPKAAFKDHPQPAVAVEAEA